MPTEQEFWQTTAAQKQIRLSVRAIVFNRARDHILVQRDVTSLEPHVAFPGGGIELGETFATCLAREFMEETGARVVHTEFLFVVENRFRFEDSVIHGIEHYFEVQLDRNEIVSCEENLRMEWVPHATVRSVDLRPVQVRDLLEDDSYRSARHLVAEPD